MTFPLEKILTISAADWFLIKEKNPEDYVAKGIHSDGYPWNEDFQKEIPENTEIIVNFEICQGNLGASSGTALIPKKYSEQS
ncbi:MAG TPA: hypothetical protein VMV95_02545 [Bacillota bacterium]|nr:hypothetical protein [Bacillota bacterium]